MRLNSALELLEAAEHGFAHCVPFLKRVQNSLCCNLLLWIVIHIWTFFLLFLSVGFRSQKPQRPYHRQFSCPCFSLAAAFTTDECRVELISGQMVLSKVLIHSEDFPLQTRAEKPINVTRPHLLRSCKEDRVDFFNIANLQRLLALCNTGLLVFNCAAPFHYFYI